MQTLLQYLLIKPVLSTFIYPTDPIISFQDIVNEFRVFLLLFYFNFINNSISIRIILFFEIVLIEEINVFFFVRGCGESYDEWVSSSSSSSSSCFVDDSGSF